MPTYSKTTWRIVAAELLDRLEEATVLPDDVGELCDGQDSREAVRTLRPVAPSAGQNDG